MSGPHAYDRPEEDPGNDDVGCVIEKRPQSLAPPLTIEHPARSIVEVGRTKYLPEFNGD